MANMGYCRFQNTSKDMDDCLDAITEQSVSSEEEVTAGKRMFRTILDFLHNEGVIEEYDESELNRMMNQACEEQY